MIISLDMYQTLFAAVCVLMLGRFLKARIGRRAVCRFHLSLLCDRHCRV